MQANLEKIKSLIQSKDKANIKIAVEILKSNPELQHQTQLYYDGLINLVGVGHINEIEFALSLVEGDAKQNEKGEWIEFAPYEHHKGEVWRTVKALKSAPFATLEQVILDRMEITPELLEAIAALPKLEILEIRRSKLEAFPREILSIQSLGLLSLRGNKIKEIPAEISALSNLYHLDLSQNKINTVPETILELEQLSHLDISSNQLTAFQAPINVRTLTLCGNEIQTIPDSLYDLKQLFYLDLSHNDIDTIDNKITELPVFTLYLNSNKIPPTRIDELRDLMPNCPEIY